MIEIGVAIFMILSLGLSCTAMCAGLSQIANDNGRTKLDRSKYDKPNEH